MQLLHLLLELNRNDWEATFAAPDPGPISELLSAAGTSVIFDATFLTDLTQTALRRLVGGFDVIVANTIASWPVVQAARAGGVRVIWYIHETRVGVDLMGKIPQIRPTLRQADLIVTPTLETARVYEAITSVPIEVVPYGIPDLGFTPRSFAALSRFLVLGTY